MRRDYLQDVNLLTLKVLRKERRAFSPRLRDDVQAAACNQSRKNHGVAEICSNGGHRRMIHPETELQPFSHSQDVIEDVSVLDANTLGASCRAAGVSHIAQVIRPPGV